jgi:hypothetical protein
MGEFRFPERQNLVFRFMLGLVNLLVCLRNLSEDYSPKFPQITIFKNREMQTIKELYDSAKRNGDHYIIVSLSDQIKKVTEISTNLKPFEFVDVFIKDYSYYTQRI